MQWPVGPSKEVPQIQTLVYKLEKSFISDGRWKADGELVCCFICMEKQLQESKELVKENESLKNMKGSWIKVVINMWNIIDSGLQNIV